MTKAEKIRAYIKECFDEYSINYREYFFYDFDNGKLEEPEWWILEDGKINMDMVEFASEILGISVKDILACNEKALVHWAKKYRYIWDIQPFIHSYRSAYYAPGYQEMVLFERLFDTKLPEPYPTDFDYADIANRIRAELKEIEKSLPGSYHKDAQINKLSVSTNVFCSFDEIKEMTESFILMVDNAKLLFIKAVNEGLSEKEILEYNLLTTLLGLRDRYFSRGYLYYSNLINAADFYKAVTLDNFYDFIIFKKSFKFEPWRCKEFVVDRELVERYLNAVPDDKGEMNRYSAAVSKIYCSFMWSDAAFLEDEDGNLTDVRERTSLYIKKTASEMKGLEEYAHFLSSYCKPPKLGGIKIAIPKYENEQLFNRAAALTSKIKANNFVDRCHDKINFGGNG